MTHAVPIPATASAARPAATDPPPVASASATAAPAATVRSVLITATIFSMAETNANTFP